MIRSFLFPLLSLIASVAFFLPASRADLIFNPNFIDAAGQTWDSTTKGVVNQAISDWKQVFSGVSGNSQTINFDVTFAHATTAGYLGIWQGGYVNIFPGTDVRPWTVGLSQTITFNVDFLTGTNKLWFDPTPATGGDQPASDWDALSVTRHEIGHMLGFTQDFYINNVGVAPVDLWASRINGSNIFDPGGLNVQMNADLSHLGTAGQLMSPALVNGVRLGISNTEARMLSLAYGYDLAAVPEPTSMVLLFGAATVGFVYRRTKRRPQI